MEGLIRNTVDENCDIIKLQVLPNQVYLHLEVAPQYGIHQLVKKLKAVSSRDLRDEFDYIKSGLPTLWTNSYCIMTEYDEEAIHTFVESQPISQREEQKGREGTT